MRSISLNLDVRRPLPVSHDMSVGQSAFLIDDQFKDIINKQCPGKLHKLLKNRLKKRINTQPVIQINHDNPHKIKVFEKTFYNQRQKTAEKDKRAHSMKIQLQKKLKINERPPSPFFKLSRASILGLRRTSLEVDTARQNNIIKKAEDSKKIIHPYIRIARKVTYAVTKQIGKNFVQNSSQIVQFSPFGSIEPVDLEY